MRPAVFPATLLGAGTGSLCRSTQSNFVIFHYTYDACMPLGSNNYFESATCRLQLSRDLGLPTAFSHCRGTVTSGKPGEVGKVGNFYYTDDLVISSCDSNDIKFRVPDGEISECRGLGLRLQNSDQLAQHLISRRLALNSDDAIRRGAHKKRSPVYRRDRASTSCRRCADPVIRAAPLTRRCDAGFKPPEEWAGF